MSYDPTSWQDKTTPVDASNLNKLEQAVSDNATFIDNHNSPMCEQSSSANDCDTMLDFGTYYFSASNIPENVPDGMSTTGGMIVVLKASNVRVQIIMQTSSSAGGISSIYSRRYSSTTWSNWGKWSLSFT